MAIVNQHIHEFLNYYIEKVEKPEYAVLLSGKWGSGKTFLINQITEKYRDKKNIVKVSLFGFKSKENIHKQVLLKLFNIDDTHDVSVTAKLVGQVLKKFTGINLSDMPMGWALKQEGNQNAIFIFDDLERANIELTELHGYINDLTEIHKQKVILLADEEKLNTDEKYLLFKEKTIGKTFQIEQDFETAFKAFIDELENAKEMLNSNKSIIKAVFDTANYQNLRSLRQGLLDFDRFMSACEDKFKNHSELMTELIQIFFAFVFETKNGKLDIQTLNKMTMLRIGKMLNENKPNEELTIIEKVFRKYSFFTHELLLSHDNWVNLFMKGNISTTKISADLNRSQYFFREQKEEWVMLWHYMWIEDDELQTALKQTLSKLENNGYLKPTIILHVAGILVEMIDQKIYDYRKDQIVDDIKKYIDTNLEELEGLYTLNDSELDGHYTYYAYRSEESEEFNCLKNYLLMQADKFRYEGLADKGILLTRHLKENNIQEFTDGLSAGRNKEILYRLPVFKVIDPKDFFDALLQVENKYMRDVLDILKNRYTFQSIVSNQSQSVLEELHFWKLFIDIVNSYEVKTPYMAKDIWIKKHCQNLVDKEIIQNIEKQLQQIEKEKSNVK